VSKKEAVKNQHRAEGKDRCKGSFSKFKRQGRINRGEPIATFQKNITGGVKGKGRKAGDASASLG